MEALFKLANNAFKNVKNQIGYCGIWCGSCVVGNGVLEKLTQKYDEIINNYDVEAWGPKDFDFQESDGTYGNRGGASAFFMGLFGRIK